MIDSYVPVACNVCDATQGEIAADEQRVVRTPIDDYLFRIRLVCCERCGLVYWSPRLTDEAMARYYEAVFRSPVWPVRPGDERREKIRSRVDWLRRFVREGSLLEIGAGEGFFLERATEAGFDAVGLEPSEAYAAVAAKVAPRARIHRAFVPEYEPAQPVDVVCAFFVLEHAMDALAFLRRCHAYLKTGGWCFLEVPDVSRYATQVDDMLWHEHTYHFSPATIERLLARAGFALEQYESPGPSYPFGMAVLARKIAGDLDWQQGLPDHAAKQQAMEGFRGHAAAIARYRDALRATLAPALNSVRAGSASLAVYGTGAFHDQLFTFGGLRAADVSLVIDDNEAKWGTTTQQGLRVERPELLKSARPDYVLIASDAFENPIADRARSILGAAGAHAVMRLHSGALAAMRGDQPAVR